MYFVRRAIMKLVKISNTVLFISSIALVLISSHLIVKVEPETFESRLDGIWWVLTTVTTVGYGDLAPATLEGRMIAVFLYIFGIGLIGVVIGKVVDAFASFRKRREEGNIVFKGRKHFIIIGWSKKAYYAIQELLQSNPNAEIVIIDEAERAPLLDENIHYVRGNPTTKDTLQRASLERAQAVLIFADESIQDSKLTDGKTLLIATAVESEASHIHTVVEVMEEEHIKNFRHVKVDEFIFSYETISSLAVRSAQTKGIAEVYEQLLRKNHGDDLFQIPKRKEWRTYEDAFHALLKEGATLISDGSNLSINRMLTEEIPDDARLFVICNKDTYEKIKK